MSLQNIDPDQLLTIEQVAKKYRVSRKTIRAYISSGRISAVRLGPKMLRLNGATVGSELLAAWQGPWHAPFTAA
jgi:excisionase family DNA binding protein